MASSNPVYLDIGKQATHPTTWNEVFAASARLDAFFDALGLRFVEREEVLKKIKYALMMREHVLICGPTGTAKSKLIDTVLSRIDDARVWDMDLTRFTGDTHLFGNYDVRVMRRSGQMFHMTEGSIAEAHFARTGEFFDASDATLRTLLGAFNERTVRRGPQLLKLPLMTVIADTNFEPDSMPQRRQALDAIIDRFLFVTRVAYAQDPANRYAMLDIGLGGAMEAPLPELSLKDVELVSGVVLAMNLVNDRYVKEAYQEMTHVFSRARKAAGRSPLSDRRFLRAAQIMEVCAILNGRTEVTFEDMKITRHVLSEDAADELLLETARVEAVEKWAQKAKRREIDAEMDAFDEITKGIPSVDPGMLATVEEIRQYQARIDSVRKQLVDFKPQSIEVRRAHIDALGRIDGLSGEADIQLINRLEASLPSFREDLALEQVAPMMLLARSVGDELAAMKLGSDKAIVRRSEASVTVMKLKTELEVAFHGRKTP